MILQLFDNNILNSIKSLESPTSIINNILDEDEVKKLINFEQNATERFANRDDARKTGLGKNGKVETDPEKWDPEIKDLLVNKIQELIGDFSIADDEYPPHFFRTTFPLSIHADTGHDGNAIVYKQLLFPLESTPTGKAKTIIFKNKWHGPAASFVPRNSERNEFQYSLLDDNGKFIVIENIKEFFNEITKSGANVIKKNEGVFTISEEFLTKVNGLANSKRYNIWTDEHISNDNLFDKAMYEKYLSHIPYYTLNSLEIEKVFDWNPGSVLVWNRTNLHASSNYIKDGVKSKLGLAIFTIRK